MADIVDISAIKFQIKSQHNNPKQDSSIKGFKAFKNTSFLYNN